MHDNIFLIYAKPNWIIDLHEFSNPDEALEVMERELFSAHKKRQEFVSIIHGIGSGVMKDRVHEALQNNPLIKDFVLEESGGSTMVRL